RRRTAVTPDGATVEIPADANSASKYFTKDGRAVAEREQEGIARDAAE
ncbi:MAG TPA: hypothetical protein GYA10_08915, partial [Alphaproteobacteria bacterium]|nr:hypothetical protein [Alphaproteobacteria bacterium]